MSLELTCGGRRSPPRRVPSWWGGYPVGESNALQTCLAHRILALVLDNAVAGGFVSINVARGVALPAATAPRDRILTFSQFLSLTDTVGTTGHGQVLTMSLAGLRWSEVAGLKVGSLRLDARRLNVVAAATEAGGRVYIGPPKSEASRRYVALPRLIVDELQTTIDGQGPEALVFPAPEGGVGRAGLVDVTPHDLRRTFGSLARAAGADLR